MAEDYTWVDNPITPTATAAPATWNECMMYLRYENNGAFGLTNYIVSGRKFTVGIDLNLTISAGENFFNRASRTRAQNTLALTARCAQLVYDTKAGTSDCIVAAFPAADAGTVCRWIIDGSNTIASSVGSNDLAKNGTVTQEDGWIGYGAKGDGSTGYYVSANSAGFPAGTAPKQVTILYTCKSITGTQAIAGYGSGAGAGFNLTQVGANLNVNDNSTNTDTGYLFEIGKTYIIDFVHDTGYWLVYVNGNLVYNVATAMSVTASVLSVLKIGSTYGSGIVHYAELRNALRTPAQIAAISNALLLPCRYYADASKPDFTDIRSILPTDAIGLGFVHTDGDSIVEFNDSDYKYGRREGAVGGNRKVFLGWKYFSGSTTLYWDNPFDTRKIKTTVVWAQDSNGTNESEIYGYYYNGSSNLGVLMGATTTKRITIATGASACLFNGAWQSSGYIGCYAEVIE